MFNTEMIVKDMKGGKGDMTEKRFERIYADVDVFCRDHNAKEVSQLIERNDYDRIVDLLNEQHEQIEDLKDANVRCCNEYSYFHKRMMQVEKENEKLKQFKEDVFNKIDMHLRMLPTARDNEFNE